MTGHTLLKFLDGEGRLVRGLLVGFGEDKSERNTTVSEPMDKIDIDVLRVESGVD